ncbi:MAG TPA: pentapeptide repeat-containing protein [Candidatus Acidoferrales bacterium]|nr:pentapeptide repeat-containing protein [Candidatus Acidoferrales bacterium]
MITTVEHEKASAHEVRLVSKVGARDLAIAVEEHVNWLSSAGESGARADFSRRNLAGADLVDAKLQEAVFNKTILRGADLTLADLRGANLLQANLAEANLLGTQFQQADLQAADLRGATGLLSSQLAGTNLFGVLLPEAIRPFDGLKLARDAAIKAGWLLLLTLLLNGLVWLRIFTTTDTQLVKNSSAFPFSALNSDLPFVPFYLFGPVLILVLYVCFHLYLQRLWEGIAQLPAIFPDGRRLDACISLFARWPARKRFKWLKNSQSPLAFLESAIAGLLLYWAAPGTVLLFWGRYLTLEDLRGTMLHILLAMVAFIAAMSFPKMAVKAFGPDSPASVNGNKTSKRKITLLLKAAPVGAGILLLLLSVGTFLGVPHNYRGAAELPGPGYRSWASDAFWAIGYNPYVQLTETDVSTKPPGWTGREEELTLVRGANLNRLRLRHVQAYRAFLAKAHFWQTDLRNAYLSEADLREANLRQADLQYAVLDHALLTQGILREADLRNSNLDRADLHGANLSFALLSDATLLDAVLEGANVYKSDLRRALLQRANLKNADLREANLEDSSLIMANLVGTYLVSANLRNARLKNSDLTQAILTDANLRKSDLSGALLQGAVVRGADLGGANLQGADLRGAVGLTAPQVCSAASLRETQMDESLLRDVSILCGNLR